MIFERFEEVGLSHYSYAIGCASNGQIAIIDPCYDVEIYLDFASDNDLVISHVFETHIHDDYTSGARHLADRAGAELVLSASEKDAAQFPHTKCKEGDVFYLGDVELKVLRTPGHLCLMAYFDKKATHFFAGDFLLCGELSGFGLDENVQICPAHGEGFGYKEESDCFSVIREYNISGKRIEMRSPELLTPKEFKERVEKGGVVLDLRQAGAFCAGHIAGSICIGWGEKLGFWAARALPYDVPIYLVSADPLIIERAVKYLASVGLFSIEGYLRGGIGAWKEAGLPLDTLKEHESLEKRGEQIVDVRSNKERENCPLEGSLHIPCQEIHKRLGELPRKPLLFVCAGGYRSVLAASLAKRGGFHPVSHLSGGLGAYLSRR